MMDPMALATPQQKAQLAAMQPMTSKIRYVVHTDDERNVVEIRLETRDPEAAALLPHLREAIVNTSVQMLYQMFHMEGERV